MAISTLHIVFSPSAAVDLRKALAEAGRNDRVVSLMDCLSFGPINPPDGILRAKWVEEELGYTGWDEVVHDAATFWDQALAPADRKIVWTSRRSTQEFSGFLEWLWRNGDAPFEFIDLTDVMVVGRDKPAKLHLAISLALLRASQILEKGLLDRAEPIASSMRDRYRDMWARLRSENAPFRIVSDGVLASAPISYFDPLLLSCATPEWQKAARVIGNALADFWETSVIQTGDLVLCARARTIAQAGGLEMRGDPADIQRCELRLPVGPASENGR